MLKKGGGRKKNMMCPPYTNAFLRPWIKGLEQRRNKLKILFKVKLPIFSAIGTIPIESGKKLSSGVPSETSLPECFLEIPIFCWRPQIFIGNSCMSLESISLNN